MTTIAVSRQNVTVEDVADALRQALGARYQVRTGDENGAERLTVTHASLPVFRARVSIARQGEETRLSVSPWGLSLLPRVINQWWMVVKVSAALRSAPGLH